MQSRNRHRFSAGLGQAIAIGLAEAGADIALVDILDMTESKSLIENSAADVLP